MHTLRRLSPLVCAISLALGSSVLLSGCTNQQAAVNQPESKEHERSVVGQDGPADERSGGRADLGSARAETDRLRDTEDALAAVREERPAAEAAATTATAAPAKPVPATVAPAPAAPPVAYRSSPAPQGVVGNIAMQPPAEPLPVADPTAGENYAEIVANPVHRVSESPVSTFSIDVDTGSYANVRRMLNGGYKPPRDAVRAEEFINYFNYDYPLPQSREVPFTLTTEMSAAPWNSQRQLLLVGLKGYEVPAAQVPKSNLVFLLDVSGSMAEPDKLPLLKDSLRLLVEELDADDSVAIVVYAGAAGMVLPPTSGADKGRILAALDALEAGGSTNGGQGIALAYDLARQAFIQGGINRVLLATDGDFNVGTSDVDSLKAMVEEQRKSGIALTTLGFGQGNYNDEMAEQLADIGNGNHYYIDSVREARKVLVEERTGTLFTIAKDVKIQIEFNPATVSEYRLIGYENRLLKREDFDNDAKDAGEIGAGHEVTALYEIVLAGAGGEQLPALKYQQSQPDQPRAFAGELAHLKLRYKLPDGEKSRLLEQPVRLSDVSTDSNRIAFAAAVAGFAELLRGDGRLGDFGYAQIADLADRARNMQDSSGLRAEFAQLVRRAATM